MNEKFYGSSSWQKNNKYSWENYEFFRGAFLSRMEGALQLFAYPAWYSERIITRAPKTLLRQCFEHFFGYQLISFLCEVHAVGG